MTNYDQRRIAIELRSLLTKIGKELCAMRLGSLEFSRKGRSNFVTEADLRSQELLIKGLSGIESGVPILSEEKDRAGIELNSPLWIIDPIDGTTNYFRHIKHAGVSVALCESGRPILGAVQSIFSEETYWAVRGNGAFLDDEPIHCSAPRDIRESLVATGMPYPEDRDATKQSMIVEAILKNCGDLRRFGAASLDGCAVATGTVDAYFESVQIWDVAAARLIVDESGGFTGTIDLGDEPETPQGLRTKNFLCAASEDNYRALYEIFHSVLRNP